VAVSDGESIFPSAQGRTRCGAPGRRQYHSRLATQRAVADLVGPGKNTSSGNRRRHDPRSEEARLRLTFAMNSGSSRLCRFGGSRVGTSAESTEEAPASPQRDKRKITYESKADIGLIGLAVMGENLVLNMESKGFTVAAFNRTVAKVDQFVGRPRPGKNIIAATALQNWPRNWRNRVRSSCWSRPARPWMS